MDGVVTLAWADTSTGGSLPVWLGGLVVHVEQALTQDNGQWPEGIHAPGCRVHMSGMSGTAGMATATAVRAMPTPTHDPTTTTPC